MRRGEYWYEFRPLPPDFNQPKIVLWKMQLCKGDFGLFLVADGILRVPRCVIRGPLGWVRESLVGVVIGMNLAQNTV